jgi:hypothetical protein
MKSGQHLIRGSRVVLNRDIVTRDLNTKEEHVFVRGTPGIVDAIYRKDGEQRFYVMLDGIVVAFFHAEDLDDADE